jgi:hypothetical protein
MLQFLTGIAEIIWQAKAWSKNREAGYHRLTLGRTSILPANHATLGPEHGSFRASSSQNGKRARPGDPFFGFMENVR